MGGHRKVAEVEWDADFTEFIGGCTDDLYRTAYGLTGQASSAVDLVQETLTRLYPQWPKVMRAESGIAYVRTSMLNRFLSERRRRSSQELPLDRLPETRNRAWAEEGPHERWDQRDALLGQLATLPPRQRAAVVLRYLHDLDDRQGAAELGCPVSTFRSLIRRALITLRTLNAPTGVAAAHDLGSTR